MLLFNWCGTYHKIQALSVSLIAFLNIIILDCAFSEGPTAKTVANDIISIRIAYTTRRMCQKKKLTRKTSAPTKLAKASLPETNRFCSIATSSPSQTDNCIGSHYCLAC